MANKEHVAILKKGVGAWNEWRKQHPKARPNLSGMDLRATHLGRAHLSRANLSNTRLNGADLREARFLEADLRCAELGGADLRHADLDDANLSGASLIDADLRGADLGWADFRGADLSGANLSRANLGTTNFAACRMAQTVVADVDLSTARGLKTVNHDGPSTVGIDTIHLSKGKIAEVFLRGAGVPEEFITYMRLLVANPIEFYSCFISYSTKDQEFAERLHGDLQNKNVRCWFAPHDVHGGKKLHEQIDEAIRVHEKVLLILSAESMNSEWVKTEIAKARKREVREKKQLLFPVRLVPFEAIRDWECFDADAGKDSAREIREYFIPDFTGWKNDDAYQKAFERLMRDLKAKESLQQPVVQS
jgi:hypothetical protein